MSESYSPKVGDRVRVTTTRIYEGEVLDAQPAGFAIKGKEGTAFFLGDGTTTKVEVEKLADPEPEWVNGDLVEYQAYDPVLERTREYLAVRLHDEWRDVEAGVKMGPHFMRNHWPHNIRIEYKAVVRILKNVKNGFGGYVDIQADAIVIDGIADFLPAEEVEVFRRLVGEDA